MSTYIQFGAGKVYVNPNAGNLATNPTPVQGKTIQDVSLEAQGDIKELKGDQQFPDDTAVGDKKGNGKFSVGRKDLQFFNQVFFADVVAAGGQSVVTNQAATPASGSATPTIPGSGTFATDLGVLYAASGIALVRVASAPAVGQYSVSAGVYSFNTSDTAATAGVLISFGYTLTTGQTYQVNNQAQGWGPQCELFLVDTYQPNDVGTGGAHVLEYNVIHLYAVKFNKLSFGNKRSDYAIQEMDFQFFANSANKVAEMFAVKG